MTVTVHQSDGVLHLLLDRPDKLNALRSEDIATVRDALDADVRAVVFRGAGGRAFSAGVDVTEFLSLTPETARAFISGLRDMLARVRTAPVVTVCAVDGYCIGGAFELALACDLRVVTTRASFGLPEIKLGIPSVIDAALLQQHVGLGIAKEMVLTGDLYAATDRKVAALCNALVEPGDLEPAVDALLAKVVGHTATVVASQKRLFETWQNAGLTTAIEVSVGEFAAAFAAADTAAALARYAAELGVGRG